MVNNMPDTPQKPTKGAPAVASIGKRYGRCLVLSISHRNKDSIAFVNIQCDCGNTKKIRLISLRNGSTVSCGCYHLERQKTQRLTHGKSDTNEYHVWAGMLDRCRNVNNIKYKDYGGRGVTVCERWTNSFPAFLYDMGVRPTDGHTIDRINNDGNYDPSNCRWATRLEQNRNTRANIRATYMGEEKTLIEWAEIAGLKLKTLHSRLGYGWSMERAMTEPVNTNFRHKVIK